MAKRPRDPVQLAKQVFDIAIGEAKDTVSESKRNPPPQRAILHSGNGPGQIRTDISVLSGQVLYPIELRGRDGV